MKKAFFILIILTFTILSFSQKYVKVWSDEFNTPGLPDSSKWTHEVGKLRNNELQYYTYKRPENARIQDTVLIIEARKEAYKGSAYTSASLISQQKGDWLYGKFEISAKVPSGRGTWPAIWMMPTDSEYGGWPRSGEIDIMEYVGMSPSTIHFTTHYQGLSGTGHSQAGSSTTTSQPFNRFIKYSVIWSPSRIEWYMDGEKYFVFSKTGTDPRIWPFDKMFYLILNYAYGGSWGGQQGVDDTKLPSRFEIDYVRVYQLQDSEGPFTINIEPSVGGIVEISPKQETYNEGTKVNFTAKAKEGYVFDKWLHIGAANPISVEVVNNLKMIPLFKKQNELIQNGTFDKGMDKWSSWFEQSASPVFNRSVIDSVFVVNITKPGTANWHIVEQQLGLPFLLNTTYKVSFDAWAANPNTMELFISKNHSDYGAYLSTIKSIGSSRQNYTWTVKMTQSSDLNCRFGFGFGRFQGKVYIDNVSIEKVVATSAESNALIELPALRIQPNPTSGLVNIQLSNISDKPVTMRLFNLNGQLISVLMKDKVYNSEHTISFDLSETNISKGIYFLQVTTSEKNISQKILLQ